jgi:hypothetical protein
MNADGQDIEITAGKFKAEELAGIYCSQVNRFHTALRNQRVMVNLFTGNKPP